MFVFIYFLLPLSTYCFIRKRTSNPQAARSNRAGRTTKLERSGMNINSRLFFVIPSGFEPSSRLSVAKSASGGFESCRACHYKYRHLRANRECLFYFMLRKTSLSASDKRLSALTQSVLKIWSLRPGFQMETDSLILYEGCLCEFHSPCHVLTDYLFYLINCSF